MWSQFVLLTKCYQGDKIMEDEVVVACSTHERSEELPQNSVGHILKGSGLGGIGVNWCKLQNMKINLKEAGNESVGPLFWPKVAISAGFL
jgi:hypothetical protein